MWDNRDAAPRCVNTEEPLTRSLELGEEELTMKATRTCKIDGCDRQSNTRGLCKRHYTRWLRYGDPTAGRPLQFPRNPDGLCSINGCSKPVDARSWCKMHYTRWARTGTTDPGVHAQVSSIDRFNRYVDRSDDCWIWLGPRNPLGYGWLNVAGPWGRRIYAHRWSWQHHNKQQVPEGFVIRHTCDNPPCVNPDHLLIGTQRDNLRDMVARNRTRWAKS